MVRKFRLFDFRLMMLASILIWMVIFNHKAESPTFVIAMSGVALWFFSRTKNPLNTALLLTALLFTSLSSTDLFPLTIRDRFIEPYAIKAVPCILVWLKILWDLYRLPYSPAVAENSSDPVNIPEK
jgi:hypothetical protein